MTFLILVNFPLIIFYFDKKTYLIIVINFSYVSDRFVAD